MEIQIIMMMVHQSCLHQKILQVIKTIGVHQQLMVGVLPPLPKQVVLIQTNGMHQVHPPPVLQATGDLQ
jgi:hypothetical protein